MGYSIELKGQMNKTKKNIVDGVFPKKCGNKKSMSQLESVYSEKWDRDGMREGEWVNEWVREGGREERRKERNETQLYQSKYRMGCKNVA